MSIWGKVIGGTAGFVVGGPLGALLGGMAGHAVDQQRAALRGPVGERVGAGDRLPAAFSVAVIALGAKMAKADGRVTRDEVEAFKRVFRISAQDMKAVGHVFDVAKRDAGGFEIYAAQAAALFRRSPAVLEELLHALFAIAKADGVVHPAELEFLRRVASIFGFGADAFKRICAGHIEPDAPDGHAVLGVAADATDDEVRAAYRRLVLEHHPDKLVAEGMPEEFIAVANDRMATINAAYDTVCKQRGMS